MKRGTKRSRGKGEEEEQNRGRTRRRDQDQVQEDGGESSSVRVAGELLFDAFVLPRMEDRGILSASACNSFVRLSNTEFFNISIADVVSQKRSVDMSCFSPMSSKIFRYLTTCLVVSFADTYSASVEECATLSCFFDAH